MELKFTFEISDAAWEFLKNLEGKFAEYRDDEWKTLEEFKESVSFKAGRRTEESFLSRNHGGTLYLIEELLRSNLVEDDGERCHLTYIVSDFGKKILKANL
jgi:hypothetical protein